MSKFTQGPWKFSDDLDYYIISQNNTTICKYFISKNSEKEDLANAHLIASAPEMYEAIEKLVLAIEKCEQYVKIDNNLENAIFLAKECLKKARGEQ